MTNSIFGGLDFSKVNIGVIGKYYTVLPDDCTFDNHLIFEGLGENKMITVLSEFPLCTIDFSRKSLNTV